MIIWAIDPGTKTGFTLYDGTSYHIESWDLSPKKKTKNNPGEPKYFRLLHLWEHLSSIPLRPGAIICEGAAGFMRGKAAIEASHKYRAVIELFAATNEITYIEIDPNDLKFFAVGKRKAEKEEMIAAAQRMGYEGQNDDEADSFLIARWYSGRGRLGCFDVPNEIANQAKECKR